MAGDASPVPAAVGAERRRIGLNLSRVYYGYWLVGAAFVAQFVAVGSQNYVIGVFLKPPSLWRSGIAASHARSKR